MIRVLINYWLINGIITRDHFLNHHFFDSLITGIIIYYHYEITKHYQQR